MSRQCSAADIQAPSGMRKIRSYSIKDLKTTTYQKLVDNNKSGEYEL